MKTFNRTSAPDTIKYNGREYHRARTTERRLLLTGYCANHSIKLIQVDVLHRNLKGRENLHGKPYEPVTFYYSSPQITPEQYKELEKLNNQANKFHAEYNTEA